MPAFNITSSGYGAPPMARPGTARRGGFGYLPQQYKNQIHQNFGDVSSFPQATHSTAMPAPGGGFAPGTSNPTSQPRMQGGLVNHPAFEDGGAVGEADVGFNGVMNDPGDPSSALDTISDVLDYGRNKHGLGDASSGGNDEGPGPLMKNAVAGVRRFVGAGVLGQAPLKAGDDAWRKFHGDDSPSALKDGGPVEDDDEDETEAIPTRPAGPGGDRPDDNPFPVKRPNPPFGKRYAAGGPVEDDDEEGPNDTPELDDDTTGAIPDDSGPDDQSGVPQAQPPSASADPQRIASYVMGADAAPPQVVAALERSVDPQNQMDPDARHMAAIQQAARQGGPEAAWGVMQNYRKQYDARKAFAAAALNGVQGKPADIASAAQAATQAYSYLPDGNTVTFQPSQTGITATVKRAGGANQPFASANLSPEQFNKWLRGTEGQYDNVMERGAPAILAELQNTNTATDAPQAGARTNLAPQLPVVNGNPTGFDGTQLGSEEDFKARGRRADALHRAANYDPELEARSKELFQSAPVQDSRRARLEWLNNQMKVRRDQDIKEKQATVKEDVANIQGNTRRDVANTYSSTKQNIEDQKNATRRDIEFAKMGVQSNDKAFQNASRLIYGALQNRPKPGSQYEKAVLQAIQANRQRMDALMSEDQGGGAQPQQPSGNTPAGNNRPPVAGARQRKGAEGPGQPWYVKKADGKWYPVGQ